MLKGWQRMTRRCKNANELTHTKKDGDARISIQILIDYHHLESEWCVWKTKKSGFFLSRFEIYFRPSFRLETKKGDPVASATAIAIGIKFIFYHVTFLLKKKHKVVGHQFQLYDIHLSWTKETAKCYKFNIRKVFDLVWWGSFLFRVGISLHRGKCKENPI
jgi:hypothetical protein